MAYHSSEYFYFILIINFFISHFYKRWCLDYTDPRLFLPSFQAAQMTHVVKGQLKGVMEEADKEKALK